MKDHKPRQWQALRRLGAGSPTVQPRMACAFHVQTHFLLLNSVILTFPLHSDLFQNPPNILVFFCRDETRVYFWEMAK